MSNKIDGNVVQLRRKQLKMTQAELAERARMSKESISRIERDAIGGPR